MSEAIFIRVLLLPLLIVKNADIIALPSKVYSYFIKLYGFLTICGN